MLKKIFLMILLIKGGVIYCMDKSGFAGQKKILSAKHIAHYNSMQVPFVLELIELFEKINRYACFEIKQSNKNRSKSCVIERLPNELLFHIILKIPETALNIKHCIECLRTISLINKRFNLLLNDSSLIVSIINRCANKFNVSPICFAMLWASRSSIKWLRRIENREGVKEFIKKNINQFFVAYLKLYCRDRDDICTLLSECDIDVNVLYYEYMRPLRGRTFGRPRGRVTGI